MEDPLEKGVDLEKLTAKEHAKVRQKVEPSIAHRRGRDGRPDQKRKGRQTNKRRGGKMAK